jgi:hypothetical protein
MLMNAFLPSVLLACAFFSFSNAFRVDCNQTHRATAKGHLPYIPLSCLYTAAANIAPHISIEHLSKDTHNTYLCVYFPFTIT